MLVYQSVINCLNGVQVPELTVWKKTKTIHEKMMIQTLSNASTGFESTSPGIWVNQDMTFLYFWGSSSFYFPLPSLEGNCLLHPKSYPSWIPCSVTGYLQYARIQHLKGLPVWKRHQIFNRGHYIANPNNALLKENPLRFPLIHPPKMGNWMIPVEDHVLATFSCNPSCVHSFFHI